MAEMSQSSSSSLLAQKLDEIFQSPELFPFRTQDSILLTLSKKLYEHSSTYDKFQTEEYIHKEKIFEWFFNRKLGDMGKRSKGKAQLLLHDISQCTSTEQFNAICEMTLSTLMKVKHEHDIFKTIFQLDEYPSTFQKQTRKCQHCKQLEASGHCGATPVASVKKNMSEMSQDERLVYVAKKIWTFRRMQYTSAHIYFKRVVDEAFHRPSVYTLLRAYMDENEVSEEHDVQLVYDTILGSAPELLSKMKGTHSCNVEFIRSTYSPLAIHKLLMEMKKEKNVKESKQKRNRPVEDDEEVDMEEGADGGGEEVI